MIMRLSFIPNCSGPHIKPAKKSNIMNQATIPISMLRRR
jgi:hypothetical protein